MCLQALEDLSCQYDNTIRGCNQQLVSFAFGGDGIDPWLVESAEDNKLFDLQRLFEDVQVRSSRFGLLQQLILQLNAVLY